MKLSKTSQEFVKFLSAPAEKANEDQALTFFREIFGNKFTRQQEAGRSDGYVPGNLVLELKGNTNDWFSGLIQGLAYSRELEFSKIVVAAHGFLGVWYLDDIPDEIALAVRGSTLAANSIGKQFAKQFKNRQNEILQIAAFRLDPSFLPSTNSLLSRDQSNLISAFKELSEILTSGERKRLKVTLKNFTNTLKEMKPFFDDTNPLAAIRAFYSVIFSWDENARAQISQRRDDSVTVNGELVIGLRPDSRTDFKRFIESRYISIESDKSKDAFFAHFDKALDAVDPEFRVKNGIYFTDLDLSRFAMWYVKQQLGDIGKHYLVIDPACGSGNLITNWRSPLELRHKVVSEIEPELLFAVERRMHATIPPIFFQKKVESTC